MVKNELRDEWKVCVFFRNYDNYAFALSRFSKY